MATRATMSRTVSTRMGGCNLIGVLHLFNEKEQRKSAFRKNAFLSGLTCLLEKSAQKVDDRGVRRQCGRSRKCASPDNDFEEASSIRRSLRPGEFIQHSRYVRRSLNQIRIIRHLASSSIRQAWCNSTDRVSSTRQLERCGNRSTR